MFLNQRRIIKEAKNYVNSLGSLFSLALFKLISFYFEGELSLFPAFNFFVQFTLYKLENGTS